MLKMFIYCTTHDDAAVVPAGDELHFMTQSEARPDGARNQVFELDAGDLYCTYVPAPGEFPDHQFIVSVFADKPENAAGFHVDGLGCDIIA